MSEFQKALSEGKMLARKMWPNAGSEKNQVSVQFIQEVKGGSPSRNPLVSLAQLGQETAPQRATAVFSFNQEILEKNGVLALTNGEIEYNFLENDHVVTANEIFNSNLEINIQVLEDFDPNEYNTEGVVVRTIQSENAKLNPQSGNYLLSNGQRIYRHTSVVVGEPMNIFVSHDAEEVVGIDEPAASGVEVKVN